MKKECKLRVVYGIIALIIVLFMYIDRIYLKDKYKKELIEVKEFSYTKGFQAGIDRAIYVDSLMSIKYQDNDR